MTNRKKDSLVISIKAFFCILNSKFFLNELTEVDFQKELTSNKQLANSSDESARLTVKNNIRKNTINRAILLRKRVCFSLLIIGSACIFAFIIKAIFYNPFQSTKHLTKILGLISIFSFSVATLARLSWAGQLYKGDTVIEQLDDRIFKLLYWLVSFCGTLAFIA